MKDQDIMESGMAYVLRGLNFQYDIEDNLWYDHRKENKYHLRVGLSGPYCDLSFKAVLFNGGYHYNSPEFRCPVKLQTAINKLTNERSNNIQD